MANTTYRDTFHLAQGCYRFTFNDTGNDGLSWWANTAGGTGTAKFARLNNTNIKVFNPDFGSQIFQAFTVGSNPLAVKEEAAKELSIDIFPNPTAGPLNMELSLPTAEDVNVDIYNSMGQRTMHKEYKKMLHDFVELDLSKLSIGIYYAKVSSSSYSDTKEIIVTK